MTNLQRILLTGLLAAGTLGAAGVAQARSDVFWSVGVGSPGVAIGVGNLPPPVYVAPQPVYVAPPPVYVQPRPVYVQPRPVYYGPPPAHYAPPRVVYRPGPGYYWGDGHHRKPRKHHRRHGDWD